MINDWTDLLKRGVDAWNSFRAEHPEASPILVGAQLQGMTLSRADFRFTRFEKVVLDRAVLQHASFEGAAFDKTDARETDFAAADFHTATILRSNLEGSRLQGIQGLSAFVRVSSLAKCDLSGSLLMGTVWESVDFEGANLNRAFLGAGAFAKVDLSVARGLDAVGHEMPTSIGIDTIMRSGGKIPEGFLRGCGVDPLIQTVLTGDPASRTDAFTHWLAQGPSIFDRCFISYATPDKRFVDRLQKRLNESGVDYWYAPTHGEWGNELQKQIEREISLRDRMLLVCSENSLTRDWVLHEIEKAIETEKRRGKRVVFPVVIDDYLFSWSHPFATRIRQVIAADFRNATRGQAFDDAFKRLLDALRSSSVSKPA